MRRGHIERVDLDFSLPGHTTRHTLFATSLSSLTSTDFASLLQAAVTEQYGADCPIDDQDDSKDFEAPKLLAEGLMTGLGHINFFQLLLIQVEVSGHAAVVPEETKRYHAIFEMFGSAVFEADHQ